jgi:UDP-N-acetylmuramoylalanine--D-glutamate ligase
MMDEVSNMNAVRMAQRLTEKGILYCHQFASFDLFENYEDRGNQFKQAVHICRHNK